MSEDFEEDVRFEAAENAETDALVVDLDGFGGPLHLLLALARKRKIDLAKISILDLADQYLLFMEAARKKSNRQRLPWRQVKGPGAAAAATAQRLGWRFDSATAIVTGDGRAIDLLLDSPAAVRLWVREAVRAWR